MHMTSAIRTMHCYTSETFLSLSHSTCPGSAMLTSLKALNWPPWRIEQPEIRHGGHTVSKIGVQRNFCAEILRIAAIFHTALPAWHITVWNACGYRQICRTAMCHVIQYTLMYRRGSHTDGRRKARLLSHIIYLGMIVLSSMLVTKLCESCYALGITCHFTGGRMKFATLCNCTFFNYIIYKKLIRVDQFRFHPSMINVNIF